MQHGLPEQAIEPTASRTGANKLGYRAVKRAFDLTATAMAVIVLSPLFLILSVIVYLGDPGAVIYGQVRIGRMASRSKCGNSGACTGMLTR